jgi:UDP-N-acetylglucosamine--N-acetylmuramyl-(pentapeptide) pyrophosphoryl-undecaprenol N-acetylglucosamine transferase
MRVLLAGGGTAGHVFPAIALAREVVSMGHDVRFVGTSAGQEGGLVSEAGFEFVAVEARPFERRVSLKAVTAPIAAVRSVKACRPLVEAADVVVGMGGYVSVPVVLAALRSRRPVVLHEQNAVPGLANRAFARPARRVALAFAEARRALPRRARTVLTGNPVRAEILAVATDRERLAKEARAELELDEGKRTIVVFGGSQGALHVNRAFAEALRVWDRSDLQVVLLTGPVHVEAVRASLPAGGTVTVRVQGFLERMELAYAVADAVVARAGATTIAEIAVSGLPSLLVPYPYATGRHQEANARALQRAGAATMVLDDELDGCVLADRIEWLLSDDHRLRSMGERARAWSKPDAANALARTVLAAGGGG